MSQPGTWVQEICGPSGTMDDQGGSSATDERSVTYRMTYHMDLWIQECNAAFAIDPASITPVTGYTEGVYENVWLLPSLLVTNSNDVLTSLIGPIEATVTIDATGACTSIVVTYKNGQYYTGETLQVMTGRSDMGEGSGPIRVNVLTGTEGRPSLCGKPYWRKDQTASWSLPKWWTMGYGRNRVESDIRWTPTLGVNTTSTTGSTSWTARNYYNITGWDPIYGRAELNGSSDGFNHTLIRTFDDSYLFRWYYNSEPGQEVFLASDTLNFGTLGWVHHDTSEGYNGSDIMGDWSYLANSTAQAQQTGGDDSDATIGCFQMSIAASIGRQGYVKPFRTLECKNWVIAGGNKNIVTTYQSSSPSGAIYSNGNASISYRQVSNYIAGRIA